MAKHLLQLEAPTTMNDCILRVIDTSVYNPDAEVICPRLHITLPGFNTATEFTEADFATGFSLNLTACDLEIQTEECGTTFNGLPDGIYVIDYSVSPNEFVKVVYNHLRITKALAKYQAVLCDLDIAACEPTKTVHAQMDLVTKAKFYLDAAKAKVEYCHEPEKGMELYKYAVKILNSFDCNSCQS